MQNSKPLMTGWQFARLPSPVSAPPIITENSFVQINLPHVWNLDTPSEGGCCLYQTQFYADKDTSKTYFICFEAVAGVARVFLNGVFLGEHRGSYSQFCVDATSSICSGENLLQVLADNTRYDNVNPLVGDFTYWGGIYREVSLIEKNPVHFDLLYYGTSGLEILEAKQDGTLHLRAHTAGASENSKIRYLISDSNGLCVAEQNVCALNNETQFWVENPHIWNGKKDPYLYTCTAQLWQNDFLCDEVKLSFGFRDVSISAETGFLLNNVLHRLNGVAKHQDFSGVGCAATPEQIDMDFRCIQEIGANAIRLSHYQHPQYTYDCCDRYGYIVWAEIPMLAMPDGNSDVLENAEYQLKELILQNRHHPSICFWGIQNEIAMMGESLEMYQGVKRLNTLTKKLDSTRISAAANLYSVNNSSQLNFLTDAIGYNIYFGWYYGEISDYSPFFKKFHERNPQTSLGVTEYGVDCNLAYHSDTPECKDYTEEFQCLFHERAYEAIQANQKLWGSFVWCMFDFSSAIRNEGGISGMNSKGLVSYDRATRKDAFYFYKGCWSEEPFVRITGRRYANRCGETTTVKVYSNQSAVTLYVNNAVFEVKTAAVGSNKKQSPIFVFKNVPLLLGENRLCAVAGATNDRITLCRVMAPDKSYVYPEKGKGNKVSNWFKQKESDVNLFPDGCYSISDKISDLLADPRTAALLEHELPEISSDPRNRRMGGMTLMRILDYNEDRITQEQTLRVNALLNEIKK